MGIMPAYFGASPWNPALKGGGGTYYNEDPSLRAYIVPDAEADFATLLRRLHGHEQTLIDGAMRRLTIVSFNRGMRLSLPMYVSSLETWEQHHTLMGLGSWFKPKELPPWTPDLWCNGGYYAQVVVNFNELSCACNLRVWGEHREKLMAALQSAIDYTNERFPKGY